MASVWHVFAAGTVSMLLLAGIAGGIQAADPLERGFAQPPDSTKPWCYWYWISDNISREGITRDLEGMKQVGIGEALIGNIFLDDVKIGKVKALSEEWWGMVEHAIREGGRIGVDIGMFNCPGWSQSGGPWIKPEQAMRYIALAEQRVKGPQHFSGRLEVPKAPYQGLAVLAFPAPKADDSQISQLKPTVKTTPAIGQAQILADGDRGAAAMFPAGAGQGSTPFVVDLEVPEPFTARSLVLVPSKTDFTAQCELQVVEEGGSAKTIRKFTVDRSNNGVNVGFLPYAPVAVSFEPVSGKHFQLKVTGVSGAAGFAEIELSGAARLERYVEKQLGKMHPTPLPMWDTYMWPPPAEVESAEYAVRPDQVVDLARKTAADSTLDWEVPAGEWVIVRMGLTPTGTRNAPASPEGQGLEVDKMNATAAQAHFDAFIGKLLDRLKPEERKAFKHVVADSYEMGSQNWTDGLGELFQQRYGYDPKPWLPVLTGRIVGSADRSDRFLWDLRRLVADQVAYGYVSGLRQACNRRGLKLWLENYGHWGFPAEFLQYGGQSDRVGGEFWATGDLGSIELRAAASAAHIYGMPIVSAEAFTSVLKFESTPWTLKKRGDWALTEGINHWVFHVNIHQPWEDRLPGVNAWFSTEFNRHNTWFAQTRAFIDYYRRCNFLLQHGQHVADVAYFIGEDAPKMTGVRDPQLPPGYDFDYINAEVIESRLAVKDGRFVLPNGKSYALLVLPRQDTTRPEVLARINDLVTAGGAILGKTPTRSPSMKDFPAADERVRRTAAGLWGTETSGAAGAGAPSRGGGKGRVFTGNDLGAALAALGVTPAVSDLQAGGQVLWTQRSSAEADIFFLSNQGERPVQINPVFRVRGKTPELWDAVSGATTGAPLFQASGAGTRVALELEGRGSVFVVFRKGVAGESHLVRIERNGEVLGDVATVERLGGGGRDAQPNATRNPAKTFTIAGWVRPDVDITLPTPADHGVFLGDRRNEAVVPLHGQSAFGSATIAGAGVSVGRNGIAVYEHSANYFAPLATAKVPITNWTHFAVVYLDNQPSIYVNGRLAAQGLRSRLQVRSSVGAGDSSAFKGDVADLVERQGALPEHEILAAASTRPAGLDRPAMPVVRLVRSSRGLQAECAADGQYVATLANGTKRSFVVEPLPAPQEISGPWTVQFPANRDVPARITLATLGSLTQHDNPAIQYFSGTAVYAKEFELTAERVSRGKRVWLDLGRVESMVDLKVNGRVVGTFWRPPFIMDITEHVKAGSNRFEVAVTGTWRNRLIADAKYPNGFPGAPGQPQFKPYLTADLKISPEEQPSPFGLIGPVRLITTHVTDLPTR